MTSIDWHPQAPSSMRSQTVRQERQARIIHFGSGGGKGVTRVMVDLAAGHVRRGRYEPIVVFRRKRGPVGGNFRSDLQAAGVRYEEVRRAPR
jgi:hypothetical protein